MGQFSQRSNFAQTQVCHHEAVVAPQSCGVPRCAIGKLRPASVTAQRSSYCLFLDQRIERRDFLSRRWRRSARCPTSRAAL